MDETFLRSAEFRDILKVFSESPYELNLYFVSSNATKISHFQHLFDLFGLPLRTYAKPIIGYQEYHDLDPATSLIRSVLDVKRSLQHLGLFFIEDSALRIEALSEGKRDVPGLATKNFLRQYSFSDIHELLKSADNRGATLVSRIGLHLPGRNDAEVFEGLTKGRISETVHKIPELGIPWLEEQSPANFFIPDGAKQTLSSLPLEISYDYDTRLRALRLMIHRMSQFLKIYEYANIVFRRSGSAISTDQCRLFPQKVIVMCGYSGSGKTTASLYMSRKYALRYLEQSDIVRLLAEELCWNGGTSDFCDQMIKIHGREYLIRSLIEHHAKSLQHSSVISGPRSPYETAFLRAHFQDVTVVFLDTPFDFRYMRHVSLRTKPPMIREEYLDLQNKEREWGIEEVRAKSDYIINNSGNQVDLFRKTDLMLRSIL